MADPKPNRHFRTAKIQTSVRPVDRDRFERMAFDHGLPVAELARNILLSALSKYEAAATEQPSTKPAA